MRRLLILTVLSVMAASAAGCGHHWFNRGAACGQPAATYADPCLSAPTVTEGTPIPGPYVP